MSIRHNLKICKMKKGQKLQYTGKGFIGFNPENLEMIFIENNGHYLKVSYESFEMLVMKHEVKEIN